MGRPSLLWIGTCAATLLGAPYQLGSKVDSFRLADLKGNPVEFASLKSKVTVLMFLSANCPVSNAYNDRMRELYRDYSPKGVQFVFVNANQNEKDAEVAKHARAVGFEFPVYRDPNSAAADQFGAQVTPEAFVLDQSGTIRYHGAIDNAQNPARITKRGLRNALDALLSGTPVETPETKAFGCTIKRARKTT